MLSVMARRPSKHLRAPRPLSSSGFAQTVVKADGTWQVQSLSADQAAKEYRCPGCNQLVGVGAAHVVAWPVQAPFGQTRAVDARRHWHTSCWARKR